MKAQFSSVKSVAIYEWTRVMFDRVKLPEKGVKVRQTQQ